MPGDAHQLWRFAWPIQTSSARGVLLLLEPGTVVAPVLYSWLAAANQTFTARSSIAGFGLQRLKVASCRCLRR